LPRGPDGPGWQAWGVNMRRKDGIHWCHAVAAIVIFCGFAVARQANLKKPAETAAKQPAAKQSKQKAPTPKLKQKISLLDVTRVSTADALKAVAAKQTGSTAKSQKGLAVAGNSKTPLSESGVIELQPAGGGSAVGGKLLVVTPQDSKGSFLKNVHGDLYGSTIAGASGNNVESGAVGATSKGGKTSVYIQTDHAQGPLPH
jgi:hypothetical protein